MRLSQKLVIQGQRGKKGEAVRYIREAFFEARTYSSLEDLNRQLETWLKDVSDKRAWQDDKSKTVLEAFDDENLADISCPYEPYEQRYVRVDKKAYITFDTNKYPVHPKHVGRNLELRATHDNIRLFWDGGQVASIERYWGKHEVIRSPGHQEQIAEIAKITRRHYRSALQRSLQVGAHLLKAWNDLGENLAVQSRKVLELVDSYGLEEVEAAASLALENGTPLYCSIELILLHKHPHQYSDAPLKLKLPKELEEIEIDHRSSTAWLNLTAYMNKGTRLWIHP
jgi:hypothetical protein